MQIKPLEKQRERAPLRVPKKWATAISGNKSLLKLFALYFEIKPLFYNGVICNYKSRYNEIAEFVGCHPNTIRYKFKSLKEQGMAHSCEKGHLHLTSIKKIAIKFDLNFNKKAKSYHELKNLGDTENVIRNLAILENFELQHKTLIYKILAYERSIKDQEAEYTNLIQGKKVNPNKAWESYLSRLHYNSDEMKNKFRKKFYNTEKEKIQNSLLFYQEQLKKNYTDAWQARTNQRKYTAKVIPDITLSCGGISRIFKLNSAAAGHYWERKFEKQGYLDVKNRRITVDSSSKPCIEERYFEGVNNGVFSKRAKRTGKEYFFKTLPNLLQINNDKLMILNKENYANLR